MSTDVSNKKFNLELQIGNQMNTNSCSKFLIHSCGCWNLQKIVTQAADIGWNKRMIQARIYAFLVQAKYMLMSVPGIIIVELCQFSL